ncbi:MAG TPA: response regulator [Oligoflexus sp.]|uniref:response regulator n=1 Tax=Oligoflexus sp. TaxID=1971216 RepID=UPI002D54A5DD|nr:response regulator [Oligoflexus sp.]HYX37286.1 response regulator [Oligoflexus sp.]
METSKPLADVKILAVDDSPDMLMLLTRILEKHGAAVTACSSVDDALERLSETKFDVIVSDIAMPERDGFELVKAVRDMESGSEHQTPAIAVSGHIDFESRTRSYGQGFQVHLGKPINQKHLVAIVERLKELDGEAVRQGFNW